MTSEGLGEVFKVASADTCRWGGRANGHACVDGERGPPSAQAEFIFFLINHLIKSLKKTKRSLKTLITITENFRSRRWGPSLTVCACLNVRSSPHRHERKFSGARVCRVTFKHLPQPLRSHILSLEPLDKFSKYPLFRPKIA